MKRKVTPTLAQAVRTKKYKKEFKYGIVDDNSSSDSEATIFDNNNMQSSSSESEDKECTYQKHIKNMLKVLNLDFTEKKIADTEQYEEGTRLNPIVID